MLVPTRWRRSPDLQAFLRPLAHQQLLHYAQRGPHQASEVSSVCLHAVKMYKMLASVPIVGLQLYKPFIRT